MNYDANARLLINYDLFETFVDIEVMCSRKGMVEPRDAFIISMFDAAIEKGRPSIALHMISTYTSILQNSASRVITNLLTKMNKGCYYELESHLTILEFLESEFH